MRSTLIEPVSLRIQRHARRRLLWLVATIAAFGCGVTTEDSTGIKPAARPPNILLIIADDVGVDQIGVYGEGTNPATTPNIDAIARRGVLFRNTWSNPVCSSTRATILTGRYGFRTGVGFVARVGEDLKDREHTLPEILARHPANRYGTAAFGKWHLNAGHGIEIREQVLAAPYRAGFSFFRGTYKNINRSYFGWQDIILQDRGNGQIELSGGGFNPEYNTSEIVNHTASWIHEFEKNRPDDPWFVWLAFNAAHQPFHKPPATLHTVDLSDPSITCKNPKPFRTPETLGPCYRAMIEAMDTEIGRLLNDELSKESLERTTIIFVGDNGSVKGVAPDSAKAFRQKGSTYEGGINVPLVIAGAGVEASGSQMPRERSALVNTTDLFSTVLELAGLDPKAVVPSTLRASRAELKGVKLPSVQTQTEVVVDSVSLLPQLRGGQSLGNGATRSFAYAELFRSGGPDPMWPVSKVVRDPQGFKLMQFYQYETQQWREELYNLNTDPNETTNLLNSETASDTARAYQRLHRQLNTIESTGWRPRASAAAQ